VDILTALPLAFVMIAGPQIISAVFFATSESWARSSGAYVLGAALSITLVVTIGFLLANVIGGGGGDDDSGLSTVDYVVLALLLFAMVQNFRTRNQSEPPKWMGKLQAATPKLAFVLGFLLLGFFPSDLVTSLSIGGHLSDDGDAWLDVLPFIGLTLLLLGSPALLVMALGHRAGVILPKVREWMTTNSWIVSEIVLAFFIVIILTG
jgi:hypothetical protein